MALCNDVYTARPLARRRALQRRFRQALERFLPGHPAAQEQLDQLLDDDVPLGTLTDVIYMGRTRKYIVRLGSGQEVTAIEQAGSTANSPPTRGDIVQVSWAADDAIALPGI